MTNMTLEELLDDNYMESKYRCLTSSGKGKIKIESSPGDFFSLSMSDSDDEATDELDDLLLEDIEELANDLIEYVKLMKTPLENIQKIQKP